VVLTGSCIFLEKIFQLLFFPITVTIRNYNTLCGKFADAVPISRKLAFPMFLLLKSQLQMRHRVACKGMLFTLTFVKSSEFNIGNIDLLF
jgi:hypothetical protein